MRNGIVALLIAVGIAAFAFLCSIWFLADYGKRTPPETYPLQQVEALMKVVESHLGGSMPTEFPAQLSHSEQCWNSLQSAMTRNENHYEIVVAGVWGDYGTPAGGTGTDTVVIDVQFPDKTRISMDFYAATLDDCRERTDVS
jgi:hypothetical protein